MSTAAPPPAAARPHTNVTITPSRGLGRIDLRELWLYRELAFFLVWRDVKVRYKQTLLGASWAVLQPFLLMVVFSIFFGHLAKLPSNDIPYPVFTYAALVPWTMFSTALAAAGTTMVANAPLVSKVYFPRLLMPAAAVIVPIVDFAIAMLVLAVMLVAYGVSPGIGLVALPAFAALAQLSAFGLGCLLSALNVRYRDFQYVVPFLVQFLLFATPVAYASSLVPGAYRVLYGLNPMTAVVEGFRWGLLGTPAPELGTILASVGVGLGTVIVGLLYFQKVERTFADLI